MADLKKPSYELAYEQRLKEIEKSIESPHKGEVKSRDPEIEVRPSREVESYPIGEGSHR